MLTYTKYCFLAIIDDFLNPLAELHNRKRTGCVGFNQAISNDIELDLHLWR